MTAASILVRPDRAYLITDAAWTGFQDGILHHTSCKAIAVDRLKAAMTFTGFIASYETPHDIRKWLEGCGDQRELIESVPDATRILFGVNERALAAADVDESPHFRLTLAMYSDERGRAEGYVCGSGTECMPPHYVPFSLRPVGMVLQPDASDAFADQVFREPVRGAVALLEHQRRSTNYADGVFTIGGWGDLATVSAAGVSLQRVVKWPDQVGRVITPCDLADAA